MNTKTLDSMLFDWARFYLSEFSEVSWGRLSMSGRIIEIARVGVYCPGTKCGGPAMPEHIEITANVISRLTPKEQLLIKEEYTGTGNQRKKAHRQQMSLGQYKSKLFRTKKKLIALFDKIETFS